MRKQCLIFMLLLAASTAVTQDLYLDERTMPHLYVIVSRIYGSYTRLNYILMTKQCLMFVLLLAASTADYFCTS